MPKSMARNIDKPMYNSNGTVVVVLVLEDDDDCSPRRLPQFFHLRNLHENDYSLLMLMLTTTSWLSLFQTDNLLSMTSIVE